MNKALSLYIHIPFCVKKCGYCDFLSFAAGNETKVSYVQALVNELKIRSTHYKDRVINSVFIGGGTPSTLPAESIEDIVRCVSDNYCLSDECEFSMEMNPGTGEPGLFDFLEQSRVINRISIGLQSTFDNELKLLGRIHTYDDFCVTYDRLRTCGIGNINVDLISAVPTQTLGGFIEGIEKIAKLSPEHISVYSLIIEEGTPFYEEYSEGSLILPSEELERKMYHEGVALLAERGYLQYEISNFAKEGFECRHNTGYWKRTDYLGMGIGAASLVEGKRWSNITDIEYYIKNSDNDTIMCDVQTLTERQQMEEFMFLGLRMTKGVSISEFRDCFGCELMGIYRDTVTKFVKAGLLEMNGDRIYLTKRGIDISNTVMCEFIEV